MNRLLPIACALLCGLPVAVSAERATFTWEEALFEWRGTAPSTDEELFQAAPAPPLVGPSDLGKQNELVFSDHQFFSLPLGRRTFEKLTVALFVKPENRGKTEHLISCRSSGKDGFVLYNMHSNWGFAAGDGTVYKIQHLNVRAGYLVKGEWQHLAVTFDRGKVAYYKDGVLVTTHQLPIDVIELHSERTRLRVGGGGQTAKRTIAPFKGRMTGIVILPDCLEAGDIPRLMAETNP